MALLPTVLIITLVLMFLLPSTIEGIMPEGLISIGSVG
jgi:hypothetical protein